MIESLRDALAAGPVTLDGGLGTLLETHGHDLSSPLWSAQLLVEKPGAVRAAHAEYAAAGARVAISASYQVAYESLAAAGMSHDDVDRLLVESIRLAREANPDGWVAASVGPFGAPRADGSEYHGRYGLGGHDESVTALRAWHGPRIEALVSGGPDVLAAETIPSLAEVQAIVDVVRGSGVPTWVSVTAAYGALRSGEPLADAYAIAASADDVVAVGVNCCDPMDVGPAIAAARSVTDKPIVVYPNSGEQWDAKNRRWMGEAGFPDRLVREWIDAGARLVGGCCRVGPEQIRRIAAITAGVN